MKMLDLFCGTKSVANAFARRGWETYTVDWDPQFRPTLTADIGTLTAEQVAELCGGRPDVIWASPDCTTFSIAAISHHRRRAADGTLEPVSDYARQCDATDRHVLELIRGLQPRYWFIENPRGGMRKMPWMQGLPRYTVTYCQYGDTRMKPTDIWTNHPDPGFRPPCHNGDPCHERAPRGAKTGTQGRKGHVERSRIPDAFCDHIAEICSQGGERRGSARGGGSATPTPSPARRARGRRRSRSRRRSARPTARRASARSAAP